GLIHVDQAQMFYTGSNPDINFNQGVGTPALNPNATFQIEDINQELLSGANYFWLVYDVDPNAVENNTVGATCTAVTVGVNDFAPVPDVGNRVVTLTDSLPENVLEFANIGDYAEVGADINIPENFSLEAWMFPQENAPTARWILGEVGGAHLEQVGDEVHFYVFAEGILQGPARAKVLINEWNHIAATYDGSFLRIYINGFEGTLASLLSGNTNVGNFELDNVFSFGASNPGEQPNPMLLDEVKLWDRVLTLAELREGQHLSLRGTEANLVNYWQFNRMQSATESLELVGENYVNINASVNRPIGLEPVGRGSSHTENIMTGDGLSPTIFGDTNLEITFNTDNPEGDVVVTYLTNQPFGDDPAPDRSHSPGYWVVNNYGDNNIDAVTMKFNMPDGTVLAPNPDEYFLHKRGSREFGAWEEMMDGLSDVSVSISGANGDNFVQFMGGNASTGLKSFSQFIVTSDQSALPITLLDFSGQRIDSERVILHWEVANQDRASWLTCNSYWVPLS
ncbi:MAG: LamG-like jellyroll fold domain-containing protein, partial [Bacteroidota bacterium]